MKSRRHVDSPGTARGAAAAKTGNPRPRNKTALLVLGMHRSGTSAVTRVFNLLGADLPSNLLSANPTNESGHWESLDLLDLHTGLLASAGSRWDDWRQFNPDWVKSGVAEDYKNKLIGVLQRDFSHSSLFVVKDPRICRFVPLWLELLDRFGAEPRIVIPIRNPLEVAASLKRRDLFPPAKSYLLWLRHVLDAEKATRGLPRAIVTFDSLLDNWRGVVDAVTKKTATRWPRRSDRSDLEIEQYLAEALRHHSADYAQLAARADVVVWVKEAYRVLSEVARGRESSAHLKQLDRIGTEFETASSAFGLVLAAETEHSEWLSRTVAEGERKIAEIGEQLAAVRSASEQQQRELGQVKEELENTQSVSLDRKKEIEILSRKLISEQSAIRERDQEIERLTRDVEAARRFLRDSQTEIQRLAGELDTARAEIERLNVERQRTADVMAATTRELMLVRGQTQQSQRDREVLSNAASELTAAQGEIGTLKAALDGFIEIGGRENRIKDLSEELQTVVGQMHGLKQALDRAVLAKDAVDVVQATRIRELETQLEGINSENDRLGEELARTAARIRDGEELAAARAAEIENGAQIRIRELEMRLETASKEKDRLADELRTAATLRQVEMAATERTAEIEDRAHAQMRALHGKLVDAEAALAKSRQDRRNGLALLRLLRSRRTARQLMKSALFDAEWYAREYPDIAESGRSPVRHYVEEGYLRGYRPNPLFDTRWYLEQYEDVRRAGINPLLHYAMYGFREGRDPGPDFQTIFYLESNPDVRSSGMNPLLHYLRHGHHEGRLPAPRD